MKHNKVFSTGIASLGLAAALVGPAFADSTVTFAQFQQASGGNQFSYNNAGAGSTFHVVTASIPVTFSYSVPNGYNGLNFAGNTVDATLNLTADAAGPATQSSSSVGTFDFEKLTNINAKFTAVTPIMGKSNLLTITDSMGMLSGEDAGDVSSLIGTTKKGDTVTYSSDFLDFSSTLNRNLALSFTSVDPEFAIDSNGYLATYTDAGTGTFASDTAPIPIGPTVVPEGTSLWMLSTALVPLAGVGFGLRRRKTAKA